MAINANGVKQLYLFGIVAARYIWRNPSPLPLNAMRPGQATAAVCLVDCAMPNIACNNGSNGLRAASGLGKLYLFPGLQNYAVNRVIMISVTGWGEWTLDNYCILLIKIFLSNYCNLAT